jgi:hypothetical protein
MAALYRSTQCLARHCKQLIVGHRRLCCALVSEDQDRRRYKTLLHRATNYFSANAICHTPSSGAAGSIKASPIVQLNYEQKRFKKKRSKKDEDEEDDDDDDASELSKENPLLMDDISNKPEDGSEFLTINIGSLRLDTFCKTAFSMTRAKVEELFYKGDIYVNGELPHKKSMDIGVGDEIDVVKSVDPDDSKMIHVKRAVILEIPDKASEHGRMKLDIQRWQDVCIESKARKSRDED